MSTSPSPPAPANPAAGRPPALARSAWLRLFVMFRRVLKPEAMAGSRDDHLAYMIALEREGALVLSGPITAADDPAGPNGLSVFRAADIAAARRLAEQDPYVERGVMGFSLAEWTAVEGSFPITVHLSDSSVRIG